MARNPAPKGGGISRRHREASRVKKKAARVTRRTNEAVRNRIRPCSTPMRAIAFIFCYNESDIIGHVVTHMYEQGIGVHLFDNWSTDNSGKIAFDAAFDFGDLLSVTHWPPDGPTPTVSWLRMLQHTEQRALAYADAYGPFWAIHHDAD